MGSEGKGASDDDGPHRALLAAAAAAALLRQHGPALAAAWGVGGPASSIPTTEGEGEGGLACLRELKQAIDGLLPPVASKAAAAGAGGVSGVKGSIWLG